MANTNCMTMAACVADPKTCLRIGRYPPIRLDELGSVVVDLRCCRTQTVNDEVESSLAQSVAIIIFIPFLEQVFKVPLLQLHTSDQRPG